METNLSQPAAEPLEKAYEKKADVQCPTNKPSRKVGPIVATLVVVVILVIVAIVLFASRTNQQVMPTGSVSNASASSTASYDQASSTAPTVKPITNTADDVQSLQNDLDKATQGVGSQKF